jgi:hypothetical protein
MGLEGKFDVSNLEAKRGCDFAVVEPRDVQSPKSRIFLDYCRSLQGTQPLPRWSDFKLHALPTDIIPFMAVVDVDGAANSFTYRFWGTGHTALKGVDMTGRPVSGIKASSLACIGQRQYEMILKERRPLIFVHAIKPYSPWRKKSRLPCACRSAMTAKPSARWFRTRTIRTTGKPGPISTRAHWTATARWDSPPIADAGRPRRAGQRIA